MLLSYARVRVASHVVCEVSPPRDLWCFGSALGTTHPRNPSLTDACFIYDIIFMVEPRWAVGDHRLSLLPPRSRFGKKS